MTSPTFAPCSHELRPGTTVCLRCQHAERGLKRARQRQLIARGVAATLMVGFVAAIGVAAATALKGRSGATRPTLTAYASAPSAGAAAGTLDATKDAASDPVDSGQTILVSAPVTAPPAGVGGTRSLAPVIPPGRTALRDTMVAERAGDTVRVRFDLVMMRTRRPDKFESIVRSTLPQVYGAPADSALQALPAGAVTRAGDLTTTLPERGLHIPVAGGRTISVWPETRPGRDGPLVIAYRTVVSR